MEHFLYVMLESGCITLKKKDMVPDLRDQLYSMSLPNAKKQGWKNNISWY